jgi:hypothetical protein
MVQSVDFENVFHYVIQLLEIHFGKPISSDAILCMDEIIQTYLHNAKVRSEVRLSQSHDSRNSEINMLNKLEIMLTALRFVTCLVVNFEENMVVLCNLHITHV